MSDPRVASFLPRMPQAMTVASKKNEATLPPESEPDVDLDAISSDIEHTASNV